jgi:sortase A
MQNNKFLNYFGSGLMILSLLGSCFLFYPFLKIYLFPPPTISIYPTQGSYVVIPKIHAEAPIIWNVDPWNSRVYLQALQQGVAHAKGTSLPGMDGTVFLFAHSSGMPWDLAKYNTIFLRLGELQKGDVIVITKSAKRYRYIVRETKVVWPNDVKYLVETKRTQLILQTCTPIGTSLQRLLVFADPQI